MAQFPSHHIASVLNNYAATLKTSMERDTFFTTTRLVVHLVQCYRNGVRGRMKEVLNDLFMKFFDVEKHFQRGQYDQNATQLREKHKDDMLAVVQIIFSHSQLTKKSLLITALIDHLKHEEPGLTEELAGALNQLTTLSSNQHFVVALSARQALIAAHEPTYEVRHNQMESILLSAIDVYGHDFHPENLQRLILSETSIFDILHDFFYHSNRFVCYAALEVYIRRSYISYDVVCVEHLDKDVSNVSTPLIHYQFILPASHPSRLTDYCVQTDSIQPFQLRTGWMVAVDSVKELEDIFNSILELFSNYTNPMEISNEIYRELETGDSSGSDRRYSTSISSSAASQTIKDPKSKEQNLFCDDLFYFFPFVFV